MYKCIDGWVLLWWCKWEICLLINMYTIEFYMFIGTCTNYASTSLVIPTRSYGLGTYFKTPIFNFLMIKINDDFSL